MNQLANKKEFYKNFTLFFIASLLIFMESLSGIFIFDSFFAFFAFFCALFCFFISWRCVRAQKTWEFLSFETIREERKKLKQDKQRILLFPSSAQNSDIDTQAAKIFTQKDTQIRNSLLWDLCYCEWLMSYKAQRACFFYLLSALLSIVAIAFYYESFDIISDLSSIAGNIAGIIAFLYWIVSVVEAA